MPNIVWHDDHGALHNIEFRSRHADPAVDIVRKQSSKREDVVKRATGEQDDEQNCDQKSGDGIADDDDTRRPYVETRAVSDGFLDAERDRDQITEQSEPEAERDRDRQLVLDELKHTCIAKITLAEIEADVIPQHQEEALVGRLIEAELLLQLFDEFRIEPLRAAIFRRYVAALGTRLSATSEVAACAA